MKEQVYIKNGQTLSAYRLLYTLKKLGCSEICYAPGSRSAPLVMAMSAITGFHKHIHYDERGLGWFALGIARATRKPVIVFTTSGSAVANLYPAVLTAALYNLPLIVITADRPDELIDCGANQATLQGRIFGSETEFLELAVDNDIIHSAGHLHLLCLAFNRARTRLRPLHINFSFREPLYHIDERFTDENELKKILTVIRKEAEKLIETMGLRHGLPGTSLAEITMPTDHEKDGEPPFYVVCGNSELDERFLDYLPETDAPNNLYFTYESVIKNQIYAGIVKPFGDESLRSIIIQAEHDANAGILEGIQRLQNTRMACHNGLTAIAAGAGLKSNILLLADLPEILADLNSLPLIRNTGTKIMVINQHYSGNRHLSEFVPAMDIREIAEGFELTYRRINSKDELGKFMEEYGMPGQKWTPEIIEVADFAD